MSLLLQNSAIVLHPPKNAIPICSLCQTPLEKQPLVKPLPLLVLVFVGTVLVLSSFPMLFSPTPSPPIIPDPGPDQQQMRLFDDARNA